MQKMLDFRETIRETLERLPQKTIRGITLKYEISYSYDEDMWRISAFTCDDQLCISRCRTYISDAVIAIRMDIEKFSSETQNCNKQQNIV